MFFTLVLVGCGGNGLTTTQINNGGIEDQGDTTPPTIEYTQEADWAYNSDPYVVNATVTDDESTVYLVALYYKPETGDWASLAMTAGADNAWTATVPSDALRSAGLYYYITAVDTAQNTAYSPDKGESDPYHVRLSE